jgi:phosphonate transport system permease protein
VIVAILFVKAIGFGALAGVAALTIASMGFIAKLFAEAIEEISMKQVEAVRATGAGLGAVLLYAVLPQVASALHGLLPLPARQQPAEFHAGGHRRRGRHRAGTLFAAFKRFDYDFVAPSCSRSSR